MSQKPEFIEINPEALTDNVFDVIGTEWMLITGGTLEAYNMMTASWGGWGILWGRPVTFCFVRPQRYTFGFMERGAYYTLSYFTREHRDVLNYCGSHSGRDGDKTAATGVHPISDPTGAVAFAEARMAIVCRKLYAQDLEEANFVDPSIVDQAYATRDFHRMYVGEIVRVLTRRS
jgi:flavin reductase (DIM6/NTAB) family NADH-FMN oxidoreductase RutF